jgi:hypothetical protein
MSGWHHPFPDSAAEFSNAFYEALDVEQADIDELLDFRDLHLPLFTAPISSPCGEARPLTTAERGPDVPPRRDRHTSERPA